MKTLYTANTPNGQKITIALQELGLEHDVIFVNLNKGEQHRLPLSDLNPNHKIPVLVESDGTTFFESGAILMHLYGETRSEVLQWLFLQVASVGPMLGQLAAWLARIEARPAVKRGLAAAVAPPAGKS